MKSNIRKNSEPKPLSKGFSEENDRKNQAPMPNEDDMSECPTLSLLQNQAGDPGTGFGIGQRMMVIPQIETAAGCDGLKLMIR